MNEALITDIRNIAQTTGDSLSELQAKFRDLKDASDNVLSLSIKVPGADYSVTEIFAATLGIIHLVDGLRADNGAYIPKLLLVALQSKLAETNTQIATTSGIFANIENNGGVKLVDTDSFAITAKNDTVHQFAKPLRALFGLIDAAFVTWYQVRLIVKTPRIGDFKKLSVELESQRDSVRAIIDDAQSLADDMRQKSERVKSLLDESIKEKEELARAAQEGQIDRKTIAEYAADATTKLADIKATDEKSAAFDETIDSYQSRFEAFDKGIEERNHRTSTEAEALQDIRLGLEAQESELKRLLGESEGLLKGATNIGLASSFSNLQAKISNELGWARFSFYVSIALLLVLSLPIALYVFPGLQKLIGALGVDVALVLPKGSIGEHATPDTLAQIAARALLLIPGIWLVRFAGARHERLFRLREQYAYKYSVASSIEGFKRQAPDLEQGIAATAFYELTFNPATRMDANSSESRYPNPAMEWLMKKLGGRAESNK